MFSTRTAWGLLPTLGICVFLSSGCVTVGETQERVVSVHPAGAQSVLVSVRMGIGELDIQGGETDLFDGSFQSNIEEWMPRVVYDVNERGTGILSVNSRDADVGIPLGEAENEWNMVLTQDLPLDLNVDMGIGEARLDVRRLRLKRLNVEFGVGELHVNLARFWDTSLKVSVDAGMGEVRITVPRSVAVRIHAEIGIGSIEAPGFERHGSELHNGLLETAPVVIDIYVDLGIGEIRIDQADEEDYESKSSLS